MEQATRFVKIWESRTIRKSKKKQEETKENDWKIKIPSLSFSQMENRCYSCEQPCHTSTKCAHKSKIPKEQWVINLAGTRVKLKIIAEHQAQQHAQAAITSSDCTTTVTTVMTQPVQVPPPQTIQINENNEIGVGWTHRLLWLMHNSRSVILTYPRSYKRMDTTWQSIICGLLYKSLISERYWWQQGCLMLSTNAGQNMTMQKSNVPKWGKVWFNKNEITNIFSLASMIKCHRVTFWLWQGSCIPCAYTRRGHQVYY